MNSNDWEFVKTLFEQTLALKEAERDSFLMSQTENKPNIYSQVKELLEADKKYSANITQVLSSNLEEIFDEQAYLSAGDKVDQYEVVRLIGQGGMGAVFEGKRQDKGFDQRVAIKVIQTNHLTKDTIARFQSERQILANLNHPNIAHLLDGGTTSDGAPYLVMEYIDGEPILDYCKNNHLGIKKRIDLFLQICKAVSYAHQNLVVHRDIKPENILVSSDGQAKLLDFGIAKILNPNATLQDIVETQVETRIMSLENAAPEQILNQDITTRTDVYALGNLLYQLLTEETLFKIKEKTRLYLEQAICETQPIKPSSAVTLTNTLLKNENYSGVNTLQKKLKGDLDNITLKALKKDPEERYRTVEQFSEDINRYLNNYPVIARAESVFYLFSRFVKRNKALVSLSSIFVISVMYFSISLSIQSTQLEREKAKAIEESKVAKQTTKFLIDIFSASDPELNDGKILNAHQLLEIGKDKIEQLNESPITQATVYETIGAIYSKLAKYKQAKELLTKALKIRQKINLPDKKSIVSSLINLSIAEYELNNVEEAIKYLRESLRLAKLDKNLQPFNMRYAMSNLAMILTQKGDFEEASSLYHKVLEIAQNRYGGDSYRTALAYKNLGYLYGVIGDLKNAVKVHEKALPIIKRDFGEINLETAHSLNHLAFNLAKLGENKLALTHALEGLSIRRKVYLETIHPELVASLNNISDIYLNLGDINQSDAYINESMALAKKLSPEINQDLGNTYFAYSRNLLAKKELEQSILFAKHGIDIFQSLWGENTLKVATGLTLQGRAYLKIKNYQEAKNRLEKAIKLRKEKLNPDHWEIAQSSWLLGKTLLKLGHKAEAKELLSHALVIMSKTFGKEHDKTKELESLLKSIN